MQFEADIIKALQHASNGFTDAVFLCISQFGTELLFLVVAVVLYWCIDKRYAYKFFNVYILGVAVNNFLKLGFRRTRPFEAYPHEVKSIGDPERILSRRGIPKALRPFRRCSRSSTAKSIKSCPSCAGA